MTNQEAVALLHDYIETSQRAVRAGVEAQTLLTHPGEATWDAVKYVVSTAQSLQELATKVEGLPDHFSEILP